MNSTQGIKVPYTVQGALFAPTLIGLMFVLKITCPAPTGAGCFADTFMTPIFMPFPFLEYTLGKWPLFYMHEPWFIVLYWALVGALVGLVADILRKEEEEVLW